MTARRHPSERVVISANGRRRYPRQQAEPFREQTWRTVWEIVAGVVVLSAWGFLLLFWLLIASAGAS